MNVTQPVLDGSMQVEKREGKQDRIARLYREGFRINDIAALVGCHRTTVCRCISRLGQTSRGKGCRSLLLEGAVADGTLVKLHKEGWSPQMLAKRFMADSETVKKRLREVGAYDPQIGLERRRASACRFTDEEVASMVAMYRQGMTQYEIAVKVGAPRSTIQTIFLKLGIKKQMVGWRRFDLVS